MDPRIPLGRAVPLLPAVVCLWAAWSVTGCDGGGGSGGGGSGGGADPTGPDSSGGTVGTSTPPAEYTAQRKAMVDMIAKSDVSQRVLDALLKVPRHEFVPEDLREQSYLDKAIPIAEGQNLTSPTLVALMTKLLELEGTEKVLEIGTGTGYQAAILGELASEVYTVEIIAKFAEKARAKLAELRADDRLSDSKIECVVGDGYKGHPAAAPYDAIIVTAAAAEVPQALKDQLRVGGRLVIPVGNYYQGLMRITKNEDGSISEKKMKVVRVIDLIELKEE